MINFTEYKTRNFRIEANVTKTSRWLNIYLYDAEITLFFDSDEEFDKALWACQELGAPEDQVIEPPSTDYQTPPYHAADDKVNDDEVPF